MKKGFTLIELMIVMTIIVVMAMILIGSLNPVALVGKANDARRKKDMARIKVAFEEYFNDRGYFPSETLITTLMDSASCGSTSVFAQLKPWPCDPQTKRPYYLRVGNDGSRPNWFKIFTKLENRQDADIPAGWESTQRIVWVNGVSYDNTQINFGRSSTNVIWYEGRDCGFGCFLKNGSGECQSSAIQGCFGINCYSHGDCTSECWVDHCNGSNQLP